MVEETIRSIRETENRADEIVREAEEQSRSILEEAKNKAEQSADEILSRAREAARIAAGQAKEAGDREEADAMAETEKAVSALKERALSREKEAVDLVISLLA